MRTKILIIAMLLLASRTLAQEAKSQTESKSGSKEASTEAREEEPSFDFEEDSMDFLNSDLDLDAPEDAEDDEETEDVLNDKEVRKDLGLGDEELGLLREAEEDAKLDLEEEGDPEIEDMIGDVNHDLQEAELVRQAQHEFQNVDSLLDGLTDALADVDELKKQDEEMLEKLGEKVLGDEKEKKE